MKEAIAIVTALVTQRVRARLDDQGNLVEVLDVLETTETLETIEVTQIVSILSEV